jgi:hypothetical protein
MVVTCDFWYHLMVFIFVNAWLVVVDRLGGANDGFLGLDFAYWVVLGWGVGVAGHAISVFFDDYMVQERFDEERWRERASH